MVGGVEVNIHRIEVFQRNYGGGWHTTPEVAIDRCIVCVCVCIRVHIYSVRYIKIACGAHKTREILRGGGALMTMRVGWLREFIYIVLYLCVFVWGGEKCKIICCQRCYRIYV